MRLAFVFAQDLDRPSGVLEKYKAMVDIWEAQGHKVHLFVIGAPAHGEQPFLNTSLQVIPKSIPARRKIESVRRHFKVIEQLTTQIRKSSPDVIYMRDLTFAPAMVSMMRNMPTVLELNTVNSSEQRITMSKSWYHFNRLTELITYRLSRGFVAVTSEIADTVAHYRRPTCVIPNGFDLARLEPPPAMTDTQRSMIFVGTPGYPWHGIDKIIEMAKRIPDWQFTIVGYNQQQLPMTSDLPNLRAYGLLPVEAYTNFLAESSVAIGTLALHRNGMQESCSLKVREYLAHGIPVLLGNHDSDFDGSKWFLKILPNYEGNIVDHIDDIRKFAESVDGKRVQRDEISHLDHRVKEPIRLDFLAARMQP